VPEGILATAYEALGRGERDPLLALLGPKFEWIEPKLEGYPLAGVHRGPEGVTQGVLYPLFELFERLSITVDEVIEGDDRSVVVGTMRGRPKGADSDWELPFVHIWEVDQEGVAARVRTYFDRSRLTIAASRRHLAEVADDLLEQAAEIRRQWAQLGDALRAATVEDGERSEAVDESGEPVEPTLASARLAAVDLAEDGASREEVDAFLRDELNVEEREPVLDEVFGAGAVADEAESGDAVSGPQPEPEPEPEHEHERALEARRLSKLFARNRS
jgi:ketosteroid isomerase-like protein